MSELEAQAKGLSDSFLVFTPACLRAGRIRETYGVYSIGIRGIDELLVGCQLPAASSRKAVWTDDFLHAYVGSSFNVAGRLLDHYQGDDRASSFRSTLRAVLVEYQKKTGDNRLEGPDGLNGFLELHSIITCSYGGFVRETEASLIEETAAPLNISGRKGDPLARALRSLRRSA